MTVEPTYDIDHSDPASDVEWLYPNGTKELNDGPKDFNLKRLVSEDDGEDVVINLELAGSGKFRQHANATYSVLIALVNNTTADLVLEFNNGDCIMRNVTTQKRVESDLECKVIEGDKPKHVGQQLEITVPKDELGQHQYFEVAGKVKYWEETEDHGKVTFTDYIWSLSGNPGSTPDNPTDPDPNGKGSGGSGFSVGVMAAVLVVVVMAIVAIVIFMVSRRR